jgi:hypothetical protein
LNSTILPAWPTNTIRETNDDYETCHQREEQQRISIVGYSEEREKSDNKSTRSSIDHLGTRQMSDNINNSNEQRPCNGTGGNGTNNSSATSRKKAINGRGNNDDDSVTMRSLPMFYFDLGGDLTSSPRFNRSNGRGLIKDGQQHKQNRVNNTNHTNGNSRQQRDDVTNLRSRHSAYLPSSRVSNIIDDRR